ncbi:methyltransferase domain-containing protein [Alphaproteobacteria bacterium]|nr:methyltransferase domain-containing protein [Alphaproteobacteria bacterium]
MTDNVIPTLALDKCRLCASKDLKHIIDLGNVPSVHILKREKSDLPLFPINLYFCLQCGLAQLPTIDGVGSIYSNSDIYSTSHQPVSHLSDLISALHTFRTLKKGLEIGCNDGRLMGALADSGFGPLVGIEPNEVTSQAARQNGLSVETAYFNKVTANLLRKRHGLFDFVVVRHVLEHISDLWEFLSETHKILREDGVLLLELPYVEPGFSAGAPNVLWEEHVNYFFEPVLIDMLENAGFRPEMRRHYTGGALVIAILAVKAELPTIQSWPSGEAVSEYLKDYPDQIKRYQAKLISTIIKAKEQDYCVVVYGAGFRSATTINTMKIGALLDVVIDDRQDLEGMIMPGTVLTITSFVKFNANRRLLILLGVGAENEAKVIDKVKTEFSEVVPLSLVYPGNMEGHCATAEILLTSANK